MMTQINKFFKTKRKGITPIIAIVLLLMMTVAAFGLTFVWVQSTQQDLMKKTGDEITGVTDKASAQIAIESIYNDTASGNITITLRNTGRYNFEDTADFTIYLDGKLQTSDITGDFAPDTIKTTIITTADKDWRILETGTHLIKVVSSKQAESTSTCNPTSAINGYC